MHRFQLHDEFGIIRGFHNKQDALNWKLTRPELKLIIMPKPPPLNFDNLGDCLL